MKLLATIVVVFMVAALSIAGCRKDAETEMATAPVIEGDGGPVLAATAPELDYVDGRLTPPEGQILFIAGQDVGSIDDYVDSVGPAPGGFTEYTSLASLEGIKGVANYGSGPHHLDYLAETYSNSAIALGLYLVNYLEPLSDGRTDHKIDALLDHLERYDRPVYLRFGYELDGPWNYYDPETFVSAWIHFHQRLQERGLDNVALVWQSAADCGGTYRDNPLSAWYPGDEYVDWIGLSYFIQVDCDYKPVEEILAFAREHQKPVLIAESAPRRYDLQEMTFSRDGRNYEDRSAEAVWDEWFGPYFEFIYNNADVIRAVAYINARWEDQGMWGPPYTSGYWGDSRVQANDTIQERWQDELNKGVWLHGGEELFSSLNGG